MAKKKSSGKTAAEEALDGVLGDAPALEKKPKKTVMLKQFMVSGARVSEDGKSYVGRKRAFILATCAQNARAEFMEFFKEEPAGFGITSCVVSAESEKDKDWLQSHQKWEEHAWIPRD